MAAAFGESRNDLRWTAVNPYLWADALGCRERSDVLGCRAMHCDLVSPPVPYPTAGTITIDGAPFGPAEGSGEYGGLGWEPGAAQFAGGETVDVQAEGGEVPAFTTTVRVPPRFAVTQPVWASEPLPVPVAEDLEVVWDGTDALPTVVTMVGYDDGGAEVVACAFDSAVGSARVPSRVLRALDAPSGALWVSRFDIELATAGDFTVARVGQAEAYYGLALWQDE
ncbi:MAG: hypothetical protein H6734_10145 [Alphaproteobacteria bacterium]|nr:hypothetical protein [Alphaproteobacteria bacterium]